MISTETEKRGAEFKKKVENYLEKNEVPNRLERIQEDGEDRDGKLMAELHNIRET